MNKFNYTNLYFDADTNTITSADIDPAISIDHVNRLTQNINSLARALGITNMTPLAAGSQVKRYKTTVVKGGKQAAEGDVVPLTKVSRKAITPLELTLNPYRKLTTAQAIQKSGRDIALNETDDALMKEVQKDVRNDFFATVTAAGATAAKGGDTLQKATAQAWATLSTYFEDKDVTPVFFVNPLDVADYLGTAQITTQEAFGFNYVENFIGLGNAFITPRVTQGSIYATAQENLNGVYVPQGGDVADAFDLTYDESGMIGMTHSRADDRASIQTLIMAGVLFYTEDAAGVIKSEIKATSSDSGSGSGSDSGAGEGTEGDESGTE